jgi:hypothetical protein
MPTTHLLKLAHVNNAANAVARVHVVESLVDAAERLAVGDELVDLQLAGHVVVDEIGELRAALDAAESAALPYAAGDELECCSEVSNSFCKQRCEFIWARLTSGSDLLASSSDTNDDALAPALVAGLQGAAHDVHVAGAVESVVEAAVGHVHQPGLNSLAVLQVLGRVDEVGCSELGRPLLLRLVHVDDDDLAGFVLDRALDDTQADTASAEDGDGGALLDTTLAGGDHRGAVAGGDTAAEQTGTVHRGLLGDGDYGDVGDDGVLGESRAAHEVQEILALALEARGAVGHHTLALCGANGTAEVGLARLAELALLALSGAVEKILSAIVRIAARLLVAALKRSYERWTPRKTHYSATT